MNIDCHLPIKIKPLWLRERLYFKFFRQRDDKFIQSFEDVSLEFLPKIRLKLIPTDISHRAIASLGFHELLLTKRLMQLARIGGLLIDVGANCGYFACLWAGINSKNHVLAFEPSPRIIDVLRLNVERNKLGSQIQVLEMALGKNNTTLPFILGPNGQTGWGGLLNEPEGNFTEVSVMRLDDILHKFGYDYIDVLKIDVEGPDAWVLQGVEKLLQKHKIRHIFFEENLGRAQKLGINAKDVRKFLSSFGYKVKTILSHAGLRDCHAWLP